MVSVLHIHRSERADPLVKALGAVLAKPSGDPFAVEVVAVPSRGVERWLAQQLSHVLGAVDGDGVCANVLFPPSSEVLDHALAAADDGYADAVQRWSSARAVWPLMRIVDDAIGAELWAAVLAAHLGSATGRRFAVSSKLARHFERYGRARPAMVRDWHAGRDEFGDGTALPSDLVWQAALWRNLRAELGPSPAELLDAACARLRANPDRLDLPERLSVFGVTRMSPTRVAALDALAAGRDVHLWLHHPSPALWAGTRSPAGTVLARHSDASTQEIRNPLLASLSRDVRELQMLVAGAASSDEHHPVPQRPDTLLGRVQQELADDTVPDGPTPVGAGDRSLAVHACHGPARQIEVVREVVLGLLRDDPTLEPRDILIMCPDVEAFAPLVAAAFGMTDEPGGHPAARLRVRLADRSLTQTNPLLGLLGQLLDLGAHRVTATELLDLAGTPPVRARFGFTDDDVDSLRQRAMGSNARWGLDAAHREPYGLSGIEQGTWRSALDRMLLGVTMEEGDQWIGDVLPLDDVDSGAIDLVGRFAEFVDRVDAAVRAMERSHTVGEWSELLVQSVLALGAPARAWQGAQLRAELDDIAEAAGESDVVLTRADIAALLRDRLSGRPTRASFRTGTLTVCTLVPMRSVPHRVVCLVGMDDGAFPRHGVVDGDDVVARDPAIGERDVRSEDRQLFLDAICAAQENLVITYTGADPRTGVPVPPCVPLGELLDAVDATATTADGLPGRDHVVVRHPLQPFDTRNFTAGDLGTSRPFSFDPSGLAGARAAVGERFGPQPFMTGPLPPLPDGDVALDDLVAFLVAPMREFLKQRLQIVTWQDDDEPEDALPLAMQGLPEWAIGERVLRHRLSGMSIDTCQQIEQRRGDLPPGRIGERLLQRVGNTVEALLTVCADERTEPARSVDVSVALDNGFALTGTIGGLHAKTLLDVTYSSLGPKQRLRSWVRYLALVAANKDPSLQALCVGKGRGGSAKRSTVRDIDPAEARGQLVDLVELRRTGLRSPLPISLKTSEVYAARIFTNSGEPDAERAAVSRWRDGDYPGECSEPAHALVLGEKAPLSALRTFAIGGSDDLTFDKLAMRLWAPLLLAEHA